MLCVRMLTIMVNTNPAIPQQDAIPKMRTFEPMIVKKLVNRVSILFLYPLWVYFFFIIPYLGGKINVNVI